MRHKDHRTCAFSALAFFFFYRWHVPNENFPTFTTNKDWFDLKVAKGVYYNKPLTYSTHYNATNCAFDACQISITKKTHAERGSGAQHSEIDDATEDELRRHGRWNMQSMESCYLTSLSRRAIRIADGLSANKVEFWLPRADMLPPRSH